MRSWPTFRVLAGSQVDLTDRFTDHDNYVQQVTEHSRDLQESGYLLESDADAIILRAIQSDIGIPLGRERRTTPKAAIHICPWLQRILRRGPG